MSFAARSQQLLRSDAAQWAIERLRLGPGAVEAIAQLPEGEFEEALKRLEPSLRRACWERRGADWNEGPTFEPIIQCRITTEMFWGGLHLLSVGTQKVGCGIFEDSAFICQIVGHPIWRIAPPHAGEMRSFLLDAALGTIACILLNPEFSLPDGVTELDHFHRLSDYSRSDPAASLVSDMGTPVPWIGSTARSPDLRVDLMSGFWYLGVRAEKLSMSESDDPQLAARSYTLWFTTAGIRYTLSRTYTYESEYTRTALHSPWRDMVLGFLWPTNGNSIAATPQP